MRSIPLFCRENEPKERLRRNCGEFLGKLDGSARVIAESNKGLSCFLKVQLKKSEEPLVVINLLWIYFLKLDGQF